MYDYIEDKPYLSIAGNLPYGFQLEHFIFKTDMVCRKCDEIMYGSLLEEKTLCAFYSEPGHDHDDNCRFKIYKCTNNHYGVISKRNRCPNPGCDWAGKETCFCHPGKKLDEYPKEESD